MVQILGGDYPLTIIMPIFMILAALVFFITTYIKDNIGKIKLLKKHKQKEEKEIIDFNLEFSHLKKQINHLSSQDSLDAITFLAKKFLADKLNISREFSFEELPRNKLDWSVIEFTKRLEDLKYSGKEITREEINHLVLYLSKILKVKSFDHEVKEKPKILSRIFPIILPKFPKIVIKLPHIKPPAVKIKLHKTIEPIEIKIPLPKKIIINLAWLFRKKEHPELKHEIKKEIHREKPKIEIPPEHHKVKHHRKSIFEKMRINAQCHKVLRLIRKAEKKSLRHPLLSKKIYDEALLMYYKLPIDKEENIAIKLNRFYEKVHGNNERELINIKHTGRKATKEALKHLKKYRNYLIIENNSFNNNLRKSLHEVKKQAVVHMARTKHRKVKSKLSKFLKAISSEESNIFSLEERSISNLLRKASSLLRTISRLEGNEGYDIYNAIKRFFSHLKMEHHLPSHGYVEIKAKPLEKEIPYSEQSYKFEKTESRYLELKPAGYQKIDSEVNPIEEIIKPRIEPLRLKAPEIKIVKKSSKLKIEPPKLPEKKISDRMKKLVEEKESVYNKLKSLEEKELDRFKHTKRMSINENIGYHDFISNLKPKSELHEEHKPRKIFEAK